MGLKENIGETSSDWQFKGLQLVQARRSSTFPLSPNNMLNQGMLMAQNVGRQGVQTPGWNRIIQTLRIWPWRTTPFLLVSSHVCALVELLMCDKHAIFDFVCLFRNKFIYYSMSIIKNSHGLSCDWIRMTH